MTRLTSHQPLNRRTGRTTSRGFSLLEALIAVVVLSTGLLALAALQSALIRSSVDARIRSAASSAAVAVLEDLRSGDYADVSARQFGGTSGNPLPAFIVPDPALAAGAMAVNVTVDEWIDNGSGAFIPGPPGPSAPVPLAEFKQVGVTVSWPDPANPGATRSVVMSDIIGPLGSSLTSPDLTDLGTSHKPDGPKVFTTSPEGPGVIPIAVGDGSDSAATNPKPVIVSQGKNNTIIETRFDVLNFRDATGFSDPDIVRIQKRVETSVIGCRCQVGATGALTGVFSAQFRPTFWDGTRYVPPKPSGATPTVGPKPPSKSTPIQSELCTDCCRDHHDNAGDVVKFDPFRAGAHTHHFPDSGGNLVVASGSSAEYLEACRLVRVDGLWRVATDLRDEFFGFLKTTSVAGKLAADPVPDPATVPIYEEFVIDALKDRFVDNNLFDDTALEALYDSKGLNAPAQINDVSKATGDPPRWLHARGLFVDHIETPARDVIEDALLNCAPAIKSTNPEDCVLPFIPFTTINLTELAEWRPSDAGVLIVSNSPGVIFGDPINPTRGRVTVRSGAPDDASADAIADMGRSNSGVALFAPIDPEDAVEVVADAQTFTLGGGGGGPTPPPTGDGFDVGVGGLPAVGDGGSGNDPVVAYIVGSENEDCRQVGPDTVGVTPRPYRCDTNSALNLAASVVLSEYNEEIPAGQSGVTTRVICFKNGKNPEDLDVAVGVCVNYGVSAVTQNMVPVLGPFTVTNPGLIGERTTINFAVIAPEDDIVVSFVEESRTNRNFVSCEYSGSGPVPSDAIFAPCP